VCVCWGGGGVTHRGCRVSIPQVEAICVLHKQAVRKGVALSLCPDRWRAVDGRAVVRRASANAWSFRVRADGIIDRLPLVHAGY